MAVDVVMPAMEMGQASARLVRWLKADGDEVAAGEPLMEIETDKVSVEIESPAAGILTDVHAAEGVDVAVGAVVARVVAATERQDAPGAPGQAPRSSPAARRLAEKLGVDVTTLAGSGPGGAVTLSDVEAAGGGERPYEVWARSPLQRRAAERLTASHRDAPQFDVTRTVDVTGFRARLPEGVTLTSGLAWVVTAALVEHPRLNAHVVADELRVFRAVHLGIAVALEDDLVVVVVRDAQSCSAADLQERLRTLRQRAATGAAQAGDLAGSTFTISNLGMLGVDRFRAILNPPEVAILAVGRTRDQLALVDGELAVRTVLDLTLSADHRAVDGAAAARFLSSVAALVEERPQPEELLP